MAARSASDREEGWEGEESSMATGDDAAAAALGCNGAVADTGVAGSSCPRAGVPLITIAFAASDMVVG
jgi:hypothetical protein